MGVCSSSTSLAFPSPAEGRQKESQRFLQALEMVVDTGWLQFNHIKRLQTTCLDICRLSRKKTGYSLRMTAEGRRFWIAMMSARNVRASWGQLVSRVPTLLVHELTWELKRLTLKDTGDGRGEWPEELQRLTFGDHFNEPIEEMVWPRGLKALNFRHYFDQPINGAVWPSGLVRISFGFYFNQVLDGVSWPAGLQELVFGVRFDQNIDRVEWPAGLKQLTFGACFNQAVDRVSWPTGLKELTFGAYFNQPVAGVSWPANLQHITFGFSFNQALHEVVWPANLRRVAFGEGFDQAVGGVVWPSGLRHLSFGHRFKEAAKVILCPEGALQVTVRESPRNFRSRVKVESVECALAEVQHEGSQNRLMGD